MPPKRSTTVARAPPRERPSEGHGPWKAAPPILAEDVDPDWSASSSESSEGSGTERTRRLELRRQQRRRRGDAQKMAMEAEKSTPFAIVNKHEANEEWLYATGQKERPPLAPMDNAPCLTLDALRGNRRRLETRAEVDVGVKVAVPQVKDADKALVIDTKWTPAPSTTAAPSSAEVREDRQFVAEVLPPNIPLNARIQKVYEAMFDEWMARGDDAIFVADDALREAEQCVMRSDAEHAPIYSSTTVLSAHRHQREHFAATVKRKETLQAAEELLNRLIRSSQFTHHAQRLLDMHHRPFVDTLSTTAKGEFSHEHHAAFRQYSVDMFAALSAHLRKHGVEADDAFFDELFDADMDASLLSVDAWEVILSIVKFEVFVDVVEDFVKAHYKVQKGLDVERRLSRKGGPNEEAHRTASQDISKSTAVDAGRVSTTQLVRDAQALASSSTSSAPPLAMVSPAKPDISVASTAQKETPKKPPAAVTAVKAPPLKVAQKVATNAVVSGATLNRGQRKGH